MANKIRKDTIFIEAVALTDNQAYVTGEVLGNYKDQYNRWITINSENKKYRNLVSNLRNDNMYKVVNQYSLYDIVNWLYMRNTDYQTVYVEMLVDAIKETLENVRCTNLEDMYRYIATNLI